MLAQLVSVALTASVKATDTKSVSSFNHFLYVMARGGVVAAPGNVQCTCLYEESYIGP